MAEALVGVAILVISAILHEVAHGYAANWLGDPTARLAGRLTLNPLPHIDVVGSLALPFILLVSGSPILFGYAKPVPYNPYNLKGRWGEGFVASAGVLTNFLIAIILGLTIRFVGEGLSPAFLTVLQTTVYLNLMLGVFNLIPIPPLDGSKVLTSLFTGAAAYRIRAWQERFEALGPGIGFILVVLLVYLLSPFFFLILNFFYTLLSGGPLLQG